MLLALAGCLINTDLYNERMAALADLDGDGVVAENDCDDLDDAVFPGAPELCNTTDDDCDGETDEYFATVAEACNGVDDDCDGETDEAAIDAATWYLDGDGDGFGAAASPVQACEAPAGHVDDATDCDDTDDDAHPGGTEVPYDGIDQDCDGADADDLDGDGFVAVEAGGDDCDDGDPLTHAGADEIWERGFTDSDCDGELEELAIEFGTDVFTGRSAGPPRGATSRR
ncbi:MAG: putative metal-binding motif-containing protein [Deltaproteobacteria bacterium]|nr:putative metal-binding motif-containing protein [Deltaproteobacteria bacterium]